jgi:hypothetical protein
MPVGKYDPLLASDLKEVGRLNSGPVSIRAGTVIMALWHTQTLRPDLSETAR